MKQLCPHNPKGIDFKAFDLFVDDMVWMLTRVCCYDSDGDDWYDGDDYDFYDGADRRDDTRIVLLDRDDFEFISMMKY